MPRDNSPGQIMMSGLEMRRMRFEDAESLAWGQMLFKKIIYLFILGCTESLLLCIGFLLLRRGGLYCDMQASHGRGFSCCKAQVLGARAQ